jgi:hypothetical protein
MYGSGLLTCCSTRQWGCNDRVAKHAGQGANMVFEDAVELTRQLQLHGATEAALRAFEASLLPRWRMMAAHSEIGVGGRGRCSVHASSCCPACH